MSTDTTMRLTTTPQDHGHMPPVGTRIWVHSINPASLADAYVNHIGVVHADGQRVTFPFAVQGDDTWFVTNWSALPFPGQRVTIREVLDAATRTFKDFAIGREVTYDHTEFREGGVMHYVRFDAAPVGIFLDDTSPTTMIEFTPQAEDSNGTALTSSELPERERRTPDERTVAIRERQAEAAIEALHEAINDAAESYGWCGSFEDWAEELSDGFPVRRQTHRSTEYSVDVALEFEWDEEQLIDLLFRSAEFPGSHPDVEADTHSVTITSTVNIRMTCDGDDTPDDEASGTIRDLLHDAGYSGFSNFNVSNYDTI